MDNNDLRMELKAVDSFPERRVLVVGDIMMDQFVWGEVSRISPEAPVPVVKVLEETFLLGGAANVVNNLLGLGARVFLAGLVGADEMGRKLLKQLNFSKVNTKCVITDILRPTVVKTRVIAHQQQVVRVDKEKNEPIGKDVTAELIHRISMNKKEIDGIIISDYSKGVISEDLVVALKKIATGKRIPILVDPKPQNIDWYHGVTLVTPNHMEAALAVNGKIGSEKDIRQIGQKLLNKLQCKSVLITRGKDGMTLFSKNNKINHIPTVAKKVFDVTGAGDTVIATLMMGLVSGLSLIQACRMANYAAGVVVGEVGTVAIQTEALKKAILFPDGELTRIDLDSNGRKNAWSSGV